MKTSLLSKNEYGQCLVAASDLPAKTMVESFCGEIVNYKDVPENEIRYVLLLSGDNWLIPENNSKYINHSCSPNCMITDDLRVVTTRKVFKDEELTISYNIISAEEYAAAPEYFFWDERWSFKCMCGSANCSGMVDRYIIREKEGKG